MRHCRIKEIQDGRRHPRRFLDALSGWKRHAPSGEAQTDRLLSKVEIRLMRHESDQGADGPFLIGKSVNLAAKAT